MERLVEILRKAVSDGASDIFIVAGGALSYNGSFGGASDAG